MISRIAKTPLPELGMVDLPNFGSNSLSRLMCEKKIKILDLSEIKNISDEEKKLSVILVQDAFSSFFDSELVINFHSFLQKLGFQVFLSSFHPNGKPLHVKGFLPQFKQVAENNHKLR